MDTSPVSPAAERLAKALSFRTISGYPDPPDPDQFTAFFEFLKRSFPALFDRATVECIDPWRLVIEIAGEDARLDPVLLLAHYDVVSAGDDQSWTHPAFANTIEDGFVWGRGALDDKGALMAILEAAEHIAETGAPLRGFVLAFGGDEELSGRHGAKQTAAVFREAGRRFMFILDEGSAVTDGILTDVPHPIALVGLTEKGHLNLTLSVEGIGGHAGRPPPSTALGALARVITRLEANPFKQRLIPTVERFFKTIGKTARGPARFAYRQPRLFWPMLRRILGAGSGTNAIVRTTQAVTMAAGSDAGNVLPQVATCNVNIRILPGETVSDVIGHYEKLLGGAVHISAADAEDVHEAPAETDPDHPGFRAIERAMNATQPEAVVTPFIVTDSTDSKHFADLSDAVFRFVPMTVTQRDLERVHGADERVSLEVYKRMIRFYTGLLQEVCCNGGSG